MNRQPESPSGRLNPPVSGQPRAEDAVGDLLRELAADWHMPPLTPDARPWPEHLRSRPGGWLWRRRGRALVAAGTMAIVLTVVASIVAVLLALPRHPGPTDGVAAPPSATATHTPRPTVNPAWLATPAPTPGLTLPPYALFGAPLPAERVIVAAGGSAALFDIGNGGLTVTTPASSTSDSRLFSLPDGSFLCACVTNVGAYDPTSQTTPTELTVTLTWLGADGTPGRSVALPHYIGHADRGVANEPDHAAVTSSLSPDGTTLYLGWVVEQPPVWKGGIDVVDLVAGQVVQTVALPDVPNQAASASAGVGGASVTVAPGGTLAMIARSLWSTGNSAPATWHATVSVRGGHLGPLAALAAGTGGLDDGTCAGSVGPAGFVTAASFFKICYGDSGAFVRRVEVSGRPLGDTSLDGSTAVGAGLGSAVDPAHHLLYLWDPFGRHLLRVDLTTGQITGQGTLPAASRTDPVADAAHAFAAWLAPAMAAKVFISPSLAISPDGSRLFAIGTATTDPLTPGGGSTGIWVFDTSSLQTVAHWAPEADYISLALNRDGSLLLAAGMPGADAAGNSSDQVASVTIYDAATGNVRAIAGQVECNCAGSVMFP